MEKTENQTLPEELAVAIIGMSGRFPGAQNIQQFWQNLVDQVESITAFSDQQLQDRGVPEALLAHEHYVKAGAFIDDIELFDPAFFDMTPREAEITDPQHRVLLECAHEAFENAGYYPGHYDGLVGVYAGVGLNTYLLSNLMPNSQLLQNLGMHQLLLGNDKCYATSRIAYKLNLTGPCMSIDTACSSGLVSILTAYKALISYDCDMALAGGAKVNSADVGYLYEPGSINSPDGHCKTFDTDAAGTVFGSGAGMLVLKRLEDAVNDKDNVLAVIRGGAVNNDGSDKVGFTAPSVNRQRDVIQQAYAFSEVPTDTISYVEAHGTGTKLGDPVELKALSEAFSDSATQSCHIGSVKTNIGHLESAAGVAGLIKVVKALNEEVIPATLNFRTPNPAIEFAQTPFKVIADNQPWPRNEQPRRACVSSFGLGGTNSHLIVEEAPLQRAVPASMQAMELLPLSAKCESSLLQAQTALQSQLDGGGLVCLQDVAYTLSVGRQQHALRAFTTASVVDGKVQLSPFSKRLTNPNNGQTKRKKIGWIIPGQGSQHLGMSRDLYARFDVYRQALDECCEYVEKTSKPGLKALLLSESTDRDLQSEIHDTLHSQPAIFTHAYAIAKQLSAWGIQPDYMLGHSLGEFVVVCLSGALTLKDTVAFVVKRAQLMNGLAAGSMVSISAEAECVRGLLKQHSLSVDVAAINTPDSVVVSGQQDAIERVIKVSKDAGFQTRKLATSHAFHSAMLEPILSEFELFASTLNFAEPEVGYVSSLTGKLITLSDIAQPTYWSQHIRQTVQFTKAVSTLLDSGVDYLFDLGPSDIASSLVRNNLTDVDTTNVISCSANHRSTVPADRVLFCAVGQFWSQGGQVNWSLLYEGRDCYRTELPGYQFQKQRYWVDAPDAVQIDQTKTPTAASQESAEISIVSDQGVDAPRNDSERMIWDIWKELLGLQHVGVFDNFFELGGQSLLASRMVTRLYEKTSVELDVSVVFDFPTVEGIAIELLKQQAAAMNDDDIESLLAELEA